MATSIQLLDTAAEREARQAVRMWALVDFGDARENAVVRDLSATGFGMDSTRKLAEGSRIAVVIGASPMLSATIVHATGGRYGCRFDSPVDPDMIDALTKDGPFASARPMAPLPALVEPEVAKLPLPLRAAAIFGSAIACWSAVLAIGFAAFA